jgi:hypothetical protein
MRKVTPILIGVLTFAASALAELPTSGSQPASLADTINASRPP